jgi:F-type H+-transporting ATPase subunit gamma
MQMVAASKMRRAQDATKATSDYTRTANELLAYLSSQGATDRHPLFQTRPVRGRLIIVVASDKGLAGAYNANVMKTYIQNLRSDDADGVQNYTIAVGRKASQFVTRLKDTEVCGTYVDLPDQLEGSEFYAILTTACAMFEEGKVDAVDIIYTQFVSSMTQTAVVERILPAGFAQTQVTSFVRDAVYEPSTEVVLEGVVRRLVGAEIFQALLDARASEHSMRMLAMKNATDNASDLAEDLTLEMNKARQAAITQELAEISGGSEALK